MSSLAASLKKQLALAQDENERHATSLDTVVVALNETLAALESHNPDFVAAMRARFGATQPAPPTVADWIENREMSIAAEMTSVGSQA